MHRGALEYWSDRKARSARTSGQGWSVYTEASKGTLLAFIIRNFQGSGIKTQIALKNDKNIKPSRETPHHCGLGIFLICPP